MSGLTSTWIYQATERRSRNGAPTFSRESVPKQITIKTDIVPEQNQLWNLFCALDWHIGRTPEKVKAAFDNSSCVVTAWKDEQLVGVGRAISDGLFYTGVYDVLVHPKHQRRGIGTKIMREILTYFAGTSFLLTTTGNTDKFYERLGFRKTRNAMVIKRPTAE